jgi:hypothetical protein
MGFLRREYEALMIEMLRKIFTIGILMIGMNAGCAAHEGGGNGFVYEVRQKHRAAEAACPGVIECTIHKLKTSEMTSPISYRSICKPDVSYLEVSASGLWSSKMILSSSELFWEYSDERTNILFTASEHKKLGRETDRWLIRKGFVFEPRVSFDSRLADAISEYLDLLRVRSVGSGTWEFSSAGNRKETIRGFLSDRAFRLVESRPGDSEESLIKWESRERLSSDDERRISDFKKRISDYPAKVIKLKPDFNYASALLEAHRDFSTIKNLQLSDAAAMARSKGYLFPANSQFQIGKVETHQGSLVLHITRKGRTVAIAQYPHKDLDWFKREVPGHLIKQKRSVGQYTVFEVEPNAPGPLQKWIYYVRGSHALVIGPTNADFNDPLLSRKTE